MLISFTVYIVNIINRTRGKGMEILKPLEQVWHHIVDIDIVNIIDRAGNLGCRNSSPPNYDPNDLDQCNALEKCDFLENG